MAGSQEVKIKERSGHDSGWFRSLVLVPIDLGLKMPSRSNKIETEAMRHINYHSYTVKIIYDFITSVQLILFYTVHFLQMFGQKSAKILNIIWYESNGIIHYSVLLVLSVLYKSCEYQFQLVNEKKAAMDFRYAAYVMQPCKIDSENWTYFRFHFQRVSFRSLIVELATILDKTQVWPRKSILYVQISQTWITKYF